MKQVKVLGPGCSRCQTLARLIEEVAAEQGVAILLHKVTDLPQIVAYGVMSTPGVVIDEQLVHAGGLPSRETITGWFKPQ